MSSRPELPSGTVTFLFTDIEGSTRLLKRLRDGYGTLLAEHHELLRAAFAAHGGQVVDTQGDSFFVVFRRAKDAVSAAVAAQKGLAGHEWPEGVEMRVRMGVHTGQAEASGGRYHGLAVHRASRIGDSAHGGQVLVSQTTRDLLDDEEEESAGIELRDLGEQRLKDLDRPVRLYQLISEGLPGEFPPLRTLAPKPKQEPVLVIAPGWKRRPRVMVPLAAVVVGGAIAAGVLLSRGSSGSAQASAGVAADSVGVFDARSGELIAQAPVKTRPSSVAAGEGAVWVANVDDDSVSRIDPKTNASVQTIPVGSGPAGVAVGGRFVWVVNSSAGTVSKIDPNANAGSGGVVDTIPVGIRPAAVAFGEGWVWVANAGDRTVTRIDARTGKPRTFSVDAGADGIAVGVGAVWVTSESGGSVTRIDPRTDGVVGKTNVGSGASAIAVGAGSVWVANRLGGTVSRIDPDTNEVLATIPVGEGPNGIAVASGGKVVWVSNELGGTLSRIDPAQGKVVQTVPTGNRPEGVAVSGNTVYVAVRTSGLAHRGGTLTVLGGVGVVESEASLIDPARGLKGYSVWQLAILTNDGLVAYRRVGGSDGVGLVPDLALSLPTRSDGGRTYTFQLRPWSPLLDGGAGATG